MARWAAIWAAAALVLAGCATVDSSPDAPAVAQQDRARAGQQHPQILAEFGGAVEGPAADYVRRIGEKTAVAAGLPGQCTFSVVNSDVVNAFAVPGCYIYITRGLLAIMNSEDELASVLGHEVGHVVADHSAKRQNTATLSTLGAIAVGVLTGSGQAMQTASQLAQLYSLSYSRDQEYESDDLGVRYLLANGYNAYAAADMLAALGAQDALNAKIANRSTDAVPTWARTHPLSADRVVRAQGQAQAAGAAPGVPPEQTLAYLQATDGLLFADDPEQGFVQGRTFAHPKLKIAFEAPQGFTLTNTSAAVMLSGPNGARAQFAGGPAGQSAEARAEAVMREVLGQAPAQVGRRQTGKVNGVNAALLPARAQNQSGQVAEVTVAAYEAGQATYHFLAIAPDGGMGPISPLFNSFRLLTDAEAAALKPRRISLVTVARGETAEAISRRMAFEDYKLERFLVLNGRAADQPLKAGEVVKIITYAQQ